MAPQKTSQHGSINVQLHGNIMTALMRGCHELEVGNGVTAFGNAICQISVASRLYELDKASS